MSRVARWIWEGRRLGARALRLGLIPPSLGVEVITSLRRSAYRAGVLRTRPLPLPAVSVGNLTVGGTGKTPIASWIARHYAEQGITPGVLLRGYGKDEGPVHRRAVMSAVVVEDPDRHRGARRAREAGAGVLILDDGFQRLDVGRDLDIVLVSAEASAGSSRVLPAGPFRERWQALAGAHLVIVTRKSATRKDAEQVAARLRAMNPQGRPIAIAELHLSGFEELFSGSRVPVSTVRGTSVLAIAGVANPASFGSQLEALGARVTLQDWPDHHAYTARDVRHIRRASAQGLVVMTAKDAVKLKALWPRSAPEPLIANIGVRWERGGDEVRRALHDLTTYSRREPGIP